MKANWEESEKMKFLHTPKAETLTSDRKVLATCLAGAAEIGNVTSVSSKEPSYAEASEGQKEEIENVAEPVEETSAEDLGFMVGEDVTKNQEPVSPVPVVQTASKLPTSKVESYSDKGSYLQRTRSLFHSFSSRFLTRSPKISSQDNKKSLYFILALVLLIVLGGITAYWFLPKAVVTIFVAPKSFQEQVNISFNTNGMFDESKAIIPAEIITSQASGDKTKSTTGAKLIGDKATGSVQIANGNGNSINLAAGTILTSTSGLKFMTNAEASVSGQLLPGNPGVATLTVTAGDIGAQYNLAKGEVFKVGVFEKSLVAATSQADFSGGSSQQIAAVSADDQKSLENDLKSELSDQTITDLQGKATENQLFVNDLAALDITSENFDHKVGDVADTLKLSLTVNATAVLADKLKLQQYAADTLKDKIPQGYAVRNSQINFKFTFNGKQNNNLLYTADISANFLPMVNPDDIISNILGKTVPVAVDYLSAVPGFIRTEVKLNPPLPGFLKTLPHVKKNITIGVTADQ